MSGLRVLICLLALSSTNPVFAQAPAPAKPAAIPAKPAAAPAAKPVVPKLAIGETFNFSTELAQIYPSSAKVRLDQRGGKPLVIFFWNTGNSIARDDLAAFDKFVKQEGLRARMDIYAVGGFTAERASAADLKDMAMILGLADVPVLADPDFLLAQRLGAEQFPEICVIGSDGKLLAKQIRGIDHGNLQATTGTKGEVTAMNAAEYLRRVATTKTGPPITRTFPFYPSDRLLTRRYPETVLPLYSELGWGKGKTQKLSSLLSGKYRCMASCIRSRPLST